VNFLQVREDGETEMMESDTAAVFMIEEIHD
jgi:hypothetical protein